MQRSDDDSSSLDDLIGYLVLFISNRRASSDFLFDTDRDNYICSQLCQLRRHLLVCATFFFYRSDDHNHKCGHFECSSDNYLFCCQVDQRFLPYKCHFCRSNVGQWRGFHSDLDRYYSCGHLDRVPCGCGLISAH
jgi:hypothetical protein